MKGMACTASAKAIRVHHTAMQKLLAERCGGARVRAASASLVMSRAAASIQPSGNENESFVDTIEPMDQQSHTRLLDADQDRYEEEEAIAHADAEPSSAPLLHPGVSLSTPVRGVTFEGRQDDVAKLSPSNRVILEKEYSNPYDPHAVAVLRPSGIHLGYIRKLFAPRFQFDSTVGIVERAGYSESADAHFARIVCTPNTPPLQFDFRPVEDDELFAKLSSEAYDAVWHLWHSQPKTDKCEICSAYTCHNENHCYPASRVGIIWSVRPHDKVQRLQMAVSICDLCDKTRRVLEFTSSQRKDWSLCRKHIGRVTGLDQTELSQHLQRMCKHRRLWRVDSDWTVDVSTAIHSTAA